MSVLSHQSYANLTTPLWLSATAPAVAQSPFAVVDNVLIPTKRTTITVNPNGSSELTLANASGVNPVRMRLVQPSGSQGLIQFNTGNVFDSFVIGQTSTTCSTDFRVAVSGVATSNLTLSNTTNGGTLSSGTTTVTLSNNGVFDIGGYFRMGSIGYVYCNAQGCNGDTSTVKYFRTATGTTVGGMGIIGTDSNLYFGTSNFWNGCNITNYQFVIDKFGIVGTYGSAFQVHDPVTPANFINFSNSAGVGYVDLVANSGLLYNQIQFGSNATAFSRNFITFGDSSRTNIWCGFDSGNVLTFADTTTQAGQYLDTTSHQYVFFTNPISSSRIPAIIVETSGIVSFPQGINVSAFVNPVFNGLIRSGTNISSGIIVSGSPVTVTNYSPIYYVFGASSSQPITFDLRSQAGYQSYANGSFMFQFWNTSSFTLPVNLVVTSNGTSTLIANVPTNNCLMIMVDFAQLTYNQFMFASAISTAGNNYMIV